jgi:hypothetical protein
LDAGLSVSVHHPELVSMPRSRRHQHAGNKAPCSASSDNVILSEQCKLRVHGLMQSTYIKYDGSRNYWAEILLWTVIPLHFLSFFGVSKSGTLDALDTLVASAATLLVLDLSGTIFFHFGKTKVRWMAGELCYLWLMTGLLLTAANFIFWYISGFEQWPNSIDIISRSLSMKPLFSIPLIYLFVSILSFLIVIIMRVFGPCTIKINQIFVLYLSFFSFFIMLVNLANVLFLRNI